MKRFTEKRDGVNVIPLRNAACGIDMPRWKIEWNSPQSFLSGDAADRLAQYEETGFEPEEIINSAFSPVCIGCEGKDEHGYRTEQCDYDKSFVKCIRQAKHLAELAEAELDGRIIMLPCKIGAKVRDINADYVFTVEKVETCIVYDKPVLIFRCGNPGTNDYTAFYDFEIGKDIEIIEGDINE